MKGLQKLIERRFIKRATKKDIGKLAYAYDSSWCINLKTKQPENPCGELDQDTFREVVSRQAITIMSEPYTIKMKTGLPGSKGIKREFVNCLFGEKEIRILNKFREIGV